MIKSNSVNQLHDIFEKIYHHKCGLPNRDRDILEGKNRTATISVLRREKKANLTVSTGRTEPAGGVGGAGYVRT
ncbi:hypothetical protein, partial [Victivallis vadensis]|uniref:hypothetical protein n=1 Tax=Victivallis vadensis TaxID=172901 RepID=UPI003AF4A1E4